MEKISENETVFVFQLEMTFHKTLDKKCRKHFTKVVGSNLSHEY